MPNPHIATIYCMLFANYIQHQFFYIAIQDCTANLGSNTWKRLAFCMSNMSEKQELHT